MRLIEKACALARAVNNLACAASQDVLPHEISPTWVCRNAPLHQINICLDATAFQEHYESLNLLAKPTMTQNDWEKVIECTEAHATSPKHFGWPFSSTPNAQGIYQYHTGVHCEVKILRYALENNLLLNPSYIGGSKLCCVACFVFIQAYNKVHGTKYQTILIPGCHKTCYAAWPAPSIDTWPIANGLDEVFQEMLQQILLLIAGTWTEPGPGTHGRKDSDSSAGSVTRAITIHLPEKHTD